MLHIFLWKHGVEWMNKKYYETLQLLVKMLNKHSAYIGTHKIRYNCTCSDVYAHDNWNEIITVKYLWNRGNVTEDCTCLRELEYQNKT